MKRLFTAAILQAKQYKHANDDKKNNETAQNIDPHERHPYLHSNVDNTASAALLYCMHCSFDVRPAGEAATTIF